MFTFVHGVQSVVTGFPLMNFQTGCGPHPLLTGRFFGFVFLTESAKVFLFFFHKHWSDILLDTGICLN